jgi:hypothetical protein
MVWSDENKKYFIIQLRDNKNLLFGDWSPTVTKASRRSKWEEISELMKARGAVFTTVENLRKVN